jgi:hypothetical protein
VWRAERKELLRGALSTSLGRLLQQGEPGGGSGGGGGGGGGAPDPTVWDDDAYAAYTGLSPGSVQMLTNALQLNCGSLRAEDVGRHLPREWGP